LLSGHFRRQLLTAVDVAKDLKRSFQRPLARANTFLGALEFSPYSQFTSATTSTISTFLSIADT
jgi:hypothetical protein